MAKVQHFGLGIVAESGRFRGVRFEYVGASPLVLALTAQQAQSAVDVEIPICSVARCGRKRITHTLGLFRFCVPHGMKFRRVTGFEGSECRWRCSEGEGRDPRDDTEGPILANASSSNISRNRDFAA